MESYLGWIIIGGVIAVIYGISKFNNVVDERNQERITVNELVIKNDEYLHRINEWENYYNTIQEQEQRLNKEEALFKRLFAERTRNYPVVGQVWSDLIKITEEERERALKFKKRPALKAAEEVKVVKHEKRELVKELIYWKYKSQNYEAIYPWLTEELEQDISNDVDADIYYSVYTEKERDDPVAQFINPEDYRKLSSLQRNQLALDRYWQRGKKTKWMVGKMYERYIGYLYEIDGWDVEYFGIHKRFEDLGRDIIAKKGSNVHVVQCKNWSKFKTIYENHIFQLFGTTYSLQKEYAGKTVTPVFASTTKLSETANEFARRLGIVVHQELKFESYPAIKCNVSPKGAKIYHLPFDQQYDTAKITPKTGDFYAATIKEAEAKGFRRAYRWNGNKS